MTIFWQNSKLKNAFGEVFTHNLVPPSVFSHRINPITTFILNLNASILIHIPSDISHHFQNYLPFPILIPASDLPHPSSQKIYHT